MDTIKLTDKRCPLGPLPRLQFPPFSIRRRRRCRRRRPSPPLPSAVSTARSVSASPPLSPIFPIHDKQRSNRATFPSSIRRVEFRAVGDKIANHVLLPLSVILFMLASLVWSKFLWQQISLFGNCCLFIPQQVCVLPQFKLCVLHR